MGISPTRLRLYWQSAGSEGWGVCPGGSQQRGKPEVEAYERLKKLIAEVEPDMQKAAGGNKAAGTRVRQSMQDIKKAAQDVREAILSLRGSGEESKGD